ncbi:MAG: hypothetical protein ABID61_05000 [Candidatus Micrarchaeota archaeon]
MLELSHMDFQAAEAKKSSNSRPQGLNVNILISNATVEKNLLMVEFLYTVQYLPNNGHVRMAGNARFVGTEATAAYEEWKKTKRITGAAGEQIWNTINYGSSINAIYVTRVLNMEPPIAPPRIKIANQVKSKSTPSKKK